MNWASNPNNPANAGAPAPAINPDYNPQRDGTVICTALHDLGHIDKRTHQLAERWALFGVDRDTYHGYLKWATPIAQKIRAGHWFFNPIFVFLGIFWAMQMAYEISKGKEGKRSIIGYLCCRLGSAFSKFVGRKKNDIRPVRS